MAWIKTLTLEEADGELADVYDEIVEKRGKLSNIMRIQSLNPRVMKAHTDLYMSIMFGKSELKRADRELIGTVVSVANNCWYCTSHHAEALNHYWKDDGRIRQLTAGEYVAAGLDGRQQAMVRYSIKLTQSPGAVSEADIEELRSEGLSDAAILDVNFIVGYFNFVNRLAEGLGVGFDADEVGGYRY